MIPDKFKFLLDEPGPKLLVESLKLYGLKEVPGKENNPRIMYMAKCVGVANKYTADSIAWCALDMAYVIYMAGKKAQLPLTGWDLLRAAQFVKFGVHVDKDKAMLGDVLIFKRPGGFHVGIYVGEDNEAYYVLGGNQSDGHNITRIAKSRLHAVRRPKYNNQPTNVRKIYFSAEGELSKNEA